MRNCIQADCCLAGWDKQRQGKLFSETGQFEVRREARRRSMPWAELSNCGWVASAEGVVIFMSGNK